MTVHDLGYASDETSRFKKLILKNRKKVITLTSLVGIYIGFEIGRKLIIPPPAYADNKDSSYSFYNTTGIFNIDSNFFTLEKTPSTLAGILSAITLGTLSGYGMYQITRPKNYSSRSEKI